MGYELYDVEVPEIVYRAVSISPEKIQEEYERLSADYAYWNEQYARALEHHLRSKLVESEVAAELRIHYAFTLKKVTTTGAGDKAIKKESPQTEAIITAYTTKDDDMKEVARVTIRAEVEKIRIRGIVEAVRAKKEMLISLGAHLRVEQEGDPAIRAYRATLAQHKVSG